MLGFQLPKGALALLAVDVQNPNGRGGAGGDRNIKIEAAPPGPDDAFVDRRQSKIVFDRGIFRARDDREHAQSTGR